MIHARVRSTSKNRAVSSHHVSSFALSAANLFSLSIALRHESESRLLFRQRARANVDAQHRSEPNVLAHALMHHVLVNASPARIALSRTSGQIGVLKFTPYTDHFDSLGFVGFDKRVVSHPVCPRELLYWLVDFDSTAT